VASWILLYSVRAPIGPFLLLGLIGSATGFTLARGAATSRRQWLAYVPDADRWKNGYFRESLARRWMTRVSWIVAGGVAGSVVAPWFPVELAMWWSIGWMVAEFADKGSEAGVAECRQWRIDDERWCSARDDAKRAEYRWAAAFPDHATYAAAWDDRAFGPLDAGDFAAAKEGRDPDTPTPRSGAIT
jgi:hypothetical protein